MAYDADRDDADRDDADRDDADRYDVQRYDFDRVVDRHGTWCTQWDYVEDRFGVAGPAALHHLRHGLRDRARDAGRAARPPGARRAGLLALASGRTSSRPITDWYAARHETAVDPGSDRLRTLGRSTRCRSCCGCGRAPGDGVVVHTPAYDAFPKASRRTGGELRGCPLDDSGGAGAAAGAARHGRAAAVLAAQPHGQGVDAGRAGRGRRELCARHGVAVISDEIHADLAHAPHVHRPWALHGAQDGRWAVVTSASKSFNIPALTGSYGIIGDPVSRDAYLRALKEADGLSSPAVLSVVAHIAAYREGGPWLDALRAYVRGNLEMVAERLDAAFPGLGWAPPEAGYLAWIDLRPLGVDDEALQRELIEEEGVAIMPGTAYGQAGFVRLNVGCPRSKAVAGVGALVRALGRLR